MPSGPSVAGELDQALAAIARQTGATLHTYPAPAVLTLLAACHQRTGGQISDLLTHPGVAAKFSNRHS